MEEIDVDGLFWLADTPDDKVAGHLKFESKSGVRLDLIGSFDATEEFALDTDTFRIHGIAGKQAVTLEECIQVNKAPEFPGLVRESYAASYALVGEHLSEGQLGKFCGVLLQLQDLLYWVDRTGLSYSGIEFKDGKDAEKITINYNLIHKETLPTDSGTIEVSFPTKLNIDRARFGIEESCDFVFHFPKGVRVWDAVSVCQLLQSLVTIGAYEPVGIVEIYLFHPEFMGEETVRDRTGYKMIKIYTKLPGLQTQLETETQFGNILFNFDDIGGLDGIGKWLKLADKYRTVVGLLHGHWYLSETFSETRFLHMVIAAEALERIRGGSQETPLKKALFRIAKDSGEVAEKLVGDIDNWASEVTKVRAANVVHRGLGSDTTVARIYCLSESLYILVVISLLKECGVAANTLSNMQNHRQFRWLAKELRRTG